MENYNITLTEPQLIKLFTLSKGIHLEPLECSLISAIKNTSIPNPDNPEEKIILSNGYLFNKLSTYEVNFSNIQCLSVYLSRLVKKGILISSSLEGKLKINNDIIPDIKEYPINIRIEIK